MWEVDEVVGVEITLFTSKQLFPRPWGALVRVARSLGYLDFVGSLLLSIEPAACHLLPTVVAATKTFASLKLVGVVELCFKIEGVSCLSVEHETPLD